MYTQIHNRNIYRVHDAAVGWAFSYTFKVINVSQMVYLISRIYIYCSIIEVILDIY